MSFRIEDILKTEVKKTQNEHCYNFENKNIDLFHVNTTNSILHKTLLNRPNIQYYRSISEPVGSENCGGWCANGPAYRQDYDVYKAKAVSYPNIYVRASPAWPNYHFSTGYVPQFYHFSKRKGGQVRFTANQTDALEKRFTSHKYLSPEDRKVLADSLKLTDRQVKTWFQNRRAKWRRCNSVSSTEITSTRFEDKHLITIKPNEMVKSQN